MPSGWCCGKTEIDQQWISYSWRDNKMCKASNQSENRTGCELFFFIVYFIYKNAISICGKLLSHYPDIINTSTRHKTGLEVYQLEACNFRLGVWGWEGEELIPKLVRISTQQTGADEPFIYLRFSWQIIQNTALLWKLNLVQRCQIYSIMYMKPCSACLK